MKVTWPSSEYDKVIDEILEKLDKAQNIFTIAHPYADGDAIGSELALYHYCKSVGKNCVVLNFEPVPEQLSWLEGYDICTDKLPDDVDFDLAILMETTEARRMGDRVNLFKRAKSTIHLDHHINVGGLGQINLMDEKASSTCEILYNILEKTGVPLSKACREALYVGIMTDTGNFRYNNSTSRAHEVISKILGNDLIVDDIYKIVYENTGLNRVVIHGLTMARTKPDYNGKIVSSWLKLEDFEKYGASEVDADGAIRNISCINGIEIAVLFKENPDNRVKVSLRSSGNIDVMAIANKFQGGGHILAAGVTLPGNMEEVKDKIIAACVDAIKEFEAKK
ncbi:MAG: bifunctional oligoribonuclease/PAP phosphatase NrnA [Candidatus Riflebacteria bacterium]|nr:bifunctional oligoribonuclease/PAP phosphatase NrnA [Candidatus Riflebacteria bacterium]